MQARLRLVQRRKALGYSQESLAQTLGVDRTTIGRWERRQTTPEPYFLPRLCRVLRLSPDELTAMLGETGGEAVTRRPAGVPGEDYDDMYRRDLLRLVTALAAYTALPAEPGARGGEDLRDISQHAQLSTHLWQVFALAPSKRSIYPVVHDQLSRLLGQLGGSQSLAGRGQLCTVTADLLQLAGEIRFDSGDYTGAAHCYTVAASAAREARAYDLWACAMTRLSYLSLSDHSTIQATEILTAAARIARRGDTCLPTRFWIASVQAQALAAQGDTTGCEYAIEASRHVTDSQPGGWLRFDSSRLDEETGGCYLALGCPARAEPYLTRALDQAPTLRRRGSLLTDLALLGVQQHDTSRLLRYAHQAAGLAETTQSAGYLGRKLAALRTQIVSLHSDPRIAELDQRIARIAP